MLIVSVVPQRTSPSGKSSDHEVSQPMRRTPPSHLARVRLLAGDSQRSLGERAEVTKETVANLESGKHEPRYSTALRLAHALGYDNPAVLFPELVARLRREEADRRAAS